MNVVCLCLELIWKMCVFLVFIEKRIEKYLDIILVFFNNVYIYVM